MIVEGETVDKVMADAEVAFQSYSQTDSVFRAHFLRSIANEISSDASEIIAAAQAETHLPEGRLQGEMTRTLFQLETFASLLEKGDWLRPVIDLAEPDRKPGPKPDLRKTLVPVGPIVVFGASNFPLAFSTAGGDTASALAAGCAVVVKSHPAHPKTSALVASAIRRASVKSNTHPTVFQHIEDGSVAIGQELVLNPVTKGVAFTGSFQGGKALFDLANSRSNPIPVFAEMSSINPVILLPTAFEKTDLADVIASSVLVGVGQFCTNPGLIIAIDCPKLHPFLAELAKTISRSQASRMLHSGIAGNFQFSRARALQQPGVELLASGQGDSDPLKGNPAIAIVSGEAFLSNHVLTEEVFGPFSIIVKCASMEEMLLVVNRLQGQLTTSVFASGTELQENRFLLTRLRDICGRIIVNGVPTGVEVAAAMHHGGPFPSSTDARFTSVGTDAIYRFTRPVSFQNFPDELLPTELRNDNVLGILRYVNNEWTRMNIQPQTSSKQ